jgi:hypothetical protein
MNMPHLPRLILAALLLAPLPAQATPVQCPARQDGEKLSTVTLFDGPPGEDASLAPDSATQDEAGNITSNWTLEYLFSIGQHLYIECDYGANKQIVLKPQRVTSCVYKTNNQGQNSLSCQ